MEDRPPVAQLLSLVLVSGIAGCSRHPAPTPAATTPGAWGLDGWVRFPPLELGHLTAAEVPFRAVSAGMQHDARNRLAAQTFAVLDAQELRALLGPDHAEVAEAGVPVLLRAVRTTTDGSRSIEEDTVQVFWRRGAVLVQNMGERDRPNLPQERYALVAWLPEAPEEVFVADYSAITGGIGDHD